MQIVVNNLLTVYEKSGQGEKTVLLLHGWGDTHKTYSQVQSALARNYQTVSLDLPGFGASQAPEVVWNLDNYASFVGDFLKKLGVSKLDLIIAHSNGAAVAIKGLSNGNLSADRAILIGAAGIRDKQKLQKMILKIIAKVGKVFTFWLPRHHKKKLQKTLYGVAGSDMLVAPHLQETFKATVSEDVQNAARKINIPVLLIYGANDRATPPSYGRQYQSQIKNSKFVEVADAEHFVFKDKFAEVMKLIKDFLK